MTMLAVWLHVRMLTKRTCRAGFGWDSCDKGNWYKQVQDKIPEIKDAGFTHVWLPPPSESVAKQVWRHSRAGVSLQDASGFHRRDLARPGCNQGLPCLG